MLDATYQRLIRAISAENDSGFLASLLKCFTDSSRVLKLETISPTYISGVVQATQVQMQTLAQKRKARSARVHGKGWEEEKEELMLIEEMEGFALDEMTALLKFLDPNHRLLVAVSSIKDLGISPADGELWGDDDEV